MGAECDIKRAEVQKKTKECEEMVMQINKEKTQS